MLIADDMARQPMSADQAAWAAPPNLKNTSRSAPAGTLFGPDGSNRLTLPIVARGQLRIYLGAAPGVGKTFAMLNEGRRRAERGTDVVVAYVETHGRANTAAQLADLELVPRRTVTHRGTAIEEMD